MIIKISLKQTISLNLVIVMIKNICLFWTLRGGGCSNYPAIIQFTGHSVPSLSSPEFNGMADCCGHWIPLTTLVTTLPIQLCIRQELDYIKYVKSPPTSILLPLKLDTGHCPQYIVILVYGLMSRLQFIIVHMSMH